MADVTYDKEVTALLVIDPYNDYDLVRGHADALGDGNGAVVERVAEFTQAMVRPR